MVSVKSYYCDLIGELFYYTRTKKFYVRGEQNGALSTKRERVGGLRLAPSCQAFLQTFSPKYCCFVQISAVLSSFVHFEHKFA